MPPGAELDVHAVGVLPQPAHRRVHEGRTRVLGAGPQRGVQHRAAHPAPGTDGKEVVRVPPRAAIADAGDRVARGVGAEPPDGRERAGEQAFPAGLVDGPVPAVRDDDVEPRRPRVDGRRETDRATADDHHVGVGRVRHPAPPGAGTRRSARSSAGMRNRSSSTAFSTVKHSAVTHDVCTSGSARPSATTAT